MRIDFSPGPAIMVEKCRVHILHWKGHIPRIAVWDNGWCVPHLSPNQQEGDGWRQKLNFSNNFFGSSEWQLEHKQVIKTGISVELLKRVREVAGKRERFHGLIYWLEQTPKCFAIWIYRWKERIPQIIQVRSFRKHTDLVFISTQCHWSLIGQNSTLLVG